MAEDLVNVVDPDSGEVGSIPQTQLAQATQLGFTPATPEQVQQHFDEKEFGTAGQQAITGLEGAASGATFGLSTGAERALGVNPEDIRKRREINPKSHMAGEAAGLVGGALTGLGEGAAVEALGAKAGAAVLGEAAGAGLGRRLGAAALKGAAENILVSGGDEVSKMFSGNYDEYKPEDAVHAAAANLALSGVLGGVIGGGLGGVGELWNATAGKKVEAALTDATNQARAAVEPSVNPTPEQAEARNAIADELGIDVNKPRPNASQVKEALKTFGDNLEPTPGMIADEDFVPKLESALSQRATFAGVAQAKELKELHEAVAKGVAGLFKNATLKSEPIVGKEIGDGLVESLNKELKPLEQWYDVHRPEMRLMSVDPSLKQESARNLLQNETLNLRPKSPEAKMLKQYAKDIQNIKNVDQLKVFRTSVNNEITKATSFTNGDPNAASVLFAVKDELNALRKGAIADAAAKTGIGEEASDISSKFIQELEDTDAKFAATKAKAKRIGVEAGIGNTGGTRQLVDRLAKTSNESLPGKIFNINDLETTQWFKQNYPREYEIARRLKLKDIYDKSISEGMGEHNRFQAGSALRQLSDKSPINPEIRQLLVGDSGVKILEDARTVYGSFPKDFNPSHTAGAVSFGDFLSPKGFVNNASDALKYAALKNLPKIQAAVGSTDAKAVGLATTLALNSGAPVSGSAFKSMVEMISQTIKGENLMGKAAGAVFKAGKEVIPQALPQEKDLEKLDKKLQGLQSNAAPLFDSAGALGHYLPDHAAAVAQTGAQAVNYLNSIRPDVTKQSPLDAEPQLTAGQKQDWMNALMIAERPLMVLDKVKKGTLAPRDIMHLKSLYPAQYTRLKSKLMSQMMDHVSDGNPIPYKTKMGLSLFMGQPLDSTMTPGGIQAAQTHGVVAANQQAQQNQAQPRQKHNMDKLAKLPGDYLTPQQARQQSRSTAKA